MNACNDVVEQIVAVLRRNRDRINDNRPAEIMIHVPPAEDPKAEVCLVLGKIKLR